MTAPHPRVEPNTWAFLSEPMIAPTGFREYDARWRFPDEINLPGVTALGLGLGTQMHERGLDPVIAVGNDYRDYSVSVKNALIIGLIEAGIQVRDIGPALTPMAYFAQIHLGTAAVAMVTASHNPNGWTGVKMGFEPPLTHGPEDMDRLRAIVLGGQGVPRPGGGWQRVDGLREAYIADIVEFRMMRPLRVLCATGNGTAGAFAPEVLGRIGVEVVPRHLRLDYTFPHYNPNPEALEMLEDMSEHVLASGADLGLGFDGDGDRCGVVDNEGHEIFADKIILIDDEPEEPNSLYTSKKREMFDKSDEVKGFFLLVAQSILKDIGRLSKDIRIEDYLKGKIVQQTELRLRQLIDRGLSRNT